jgi:hypothetical protein
MMLTLISATLTLISASSRGCFSEAKKNYQFDEFIDDVDHRLSPAAGCFSEAEKLVISI